MKKILFTAIFVLITNLVSAQVTQPLNVAILVYQGMQIQDFAGPAEVFIKAGEVSRGQYHVYTTGFNTKSILAEGNISMQPTYEISNMPKPDILVIPGAGMKVIDVLRKDSSMLSFIRQYKDSAAVTMSVCTGAYLLAGAGILNGHKATTHFFVADDFAETFPAVSLVKEVRYVDEGKIVTTSGVTSGIDGALQLVKRYSGDKIAGMVSRGMQYVPHEQEPWPVAPTGMKFRQTAKATSVPVDVVCGMTIADKHFSTSYNGHTYYFCSEACKKKFLNKPSAFVKK